MYTKQADQADNTRGQRTLFESRKGPGENLVVHLAECFAKVRKEGEANRGAR